MSLQVTAGSGSCEPIVEQQFYDFLRHEQRTVLSQLLVTHLHLLFASLSSLPLPPLPLAVTLVLSHWSATTGVVWFPLLTVGEEEQGEENLVSSGVLYDHRFSRKLLVGVERKQKAPRGDLLGLNICSHIILSFAQGCSFPRRAAHKHTPSYRSRRHTLICPFFFLPMWCFCKCCVCLPAGCVRQLHLPVG